MLVRQESESSPADEYDDDTGDPLPVVSSCQGFAAFTDIQSYLLCYGSDANQTYHLLKDLEIELTKTSSNTCKQSLITDFCSNNIM